MINKRKEEISNEQLNEFFAQVKIGRITKENFQKFICNPENYSKNSTKNQDEKFLSDIYYVRVNYNTFDHKVLLEKLVEEGKYDFVNEELVDEIFCCPALKSGNLEIDFQLVHLEKEATKAEEILLFMGKNNLRPANIFEILSFGIKYPEMQTKFPIFALGSSWISKDKGHRLIPCLFGSEEYKRFLNFGYLEGTFSKNAHFLAVGKTIAIEDDVKKTFGGSYDAIINYNKTFEEMVKEGKHDHVDDEFINTKFFPTWGIGKMHLSFELISFQKEDDRFKEFDFTSHGCAKLKDIDNYLEKNNLRSATLPELLAFGAKYPDLQCKNKIITSCVSEYYLQYYRQIPFLSKNSSGRCVKTSNFHATDQAFSSEFQFLVVHE